MQCVFGCMHHTNVYVHVCLSPGDMCLCICVCIWWWSIGVSVLVYSNVCVCVYTCVRVLNVCVCVCVVLCMHRWTCMCSHIYAGLGMGWFNGKSFGIRQIWVQILTLQFISYMSPCYSPPWLPPLQDGMIPPFS